MASAYWLNFSYKTSSQVVLAQGLSPTSYNGMITPLISQFQNFNYDSSFIRKCYSVFPNTFIFDFCNSAIHMLQSVIYGLNWVQRSQLRHEFILGMSFGNKSGMNYTFVREFWVLNCRNLECATKAKKKEKRKVVPWYLQINKWPILRHPSVSSQDE